MKKIITIAFTILFLGLKAQITVQGGTGPHGGTLNVKEGFKIEMVSSFGCLIAYLYDIDLAPIPNKGIKAEAELVYSDNASINLKLLPYEASGFMTEVTNPYYLYCILTVNISGELIATKFLNQNGMAENKKVNKKDKCE